MHLQTERKIYVCLKYMFVLIFSCHPFQRENRISLSDAAGMRTNMVLCACRFGVVLSA